MKTSVSSHTRQGGGMMIVYQT